MIERNIFFCNYQAYNIAETISHVYLCRDRLNIPLEIFDSVISDLIDLKYLVVTHDDPMVDLYTHQMIPRTAWFRRFGIADTTFDADDSTVGTFDIEMSNLTTEGDSIDADDEQRLVLGSRMLPIRLDFSDDDSTITLLSVDLSDHGEDDWVIHPSDEEN